MPALYDLTGDPTADVRALLRAARAVIADPARFAPATCDAHGQPAHATTADAVRFDGVGALSRAAGHPCTTASGYRDYLEAGDRVEAVAGALLPAGVDHPMPLVWLGEQRGHRAVLAVYDHAIRDLDRPAPRVRELTAAALVWESARYLYRRVVHGDGGALPPPDALAVLRAARARIADPAWWCAGVMARDSDGQEVDPRSPAAVQWCAVAAVERAASDLLVGWAVEHEAIRALESAARLLHGDWLPQEVNDDPGLGHRFVVELYDAAIHHLTEAES